MPSRTFLLIPSCNINNSRDEDIFLATDECFDR